MIVEKAPAKVNLALHVTGRRADGYHLLDTLVVFPDLGDRLSLSPGEGLTFGLSGPFAWALADEPDNLVLRAARALAGDRRLGTHIALEKNLPVAAGLGGGSADAAAALRGLARLWGEGQAALPGIAASLGADVPMCLASRPARAQGIGEHLSHLPRLPQAHLVLVNPGIPVPTAEVFQRLPRADNPPLPEPAWSSFASFVVALAGARNDLEAPSIDRCPEIARVLSALGACKSCALARMSGSGATCFGLFERAAEAEAARARIRAAEPGWWAEVGPITAAEPR